MIPANVVVPYVGTNASIPPGWSRDTTLDDKFLKQILNSGTAPGTTGGTDNHSHVSTAHGHTFTSHGHTWPDIANASAPLHTDGKGCFSGLPSTQYGATVHGHQMSGSSDATATNSDGPNWDAHAEFAPYVRAIFIKSDGSPTGFPANSLVFFNAAAPSGWGVADGGSGRANAVGKLIRGAAASGDGGANAGTGNSHTHTQDHSHVHTKHGHTETVAVIITFDSQTKNPTNPITNVTAKDHGHPGVTTSGNDNLGSTASTVVTSTGGDMTPPWHKMLPIQNTSTGAHAPKGAIVLWFGTIASIPANYKLCDGTGGTPNLCQDKYQMGATNTGENGTTGGNTTHNHSGASHNHTPNDSGHVHAKSANPGGFGDQVGTGTPPTGCGLNWDGAHQHGPGADSAGGALPTSSSVTPDSTAASNAPTFKTAAFIQLQVEDALPQILMPD